MQRRVVIPYRRFGATYRSNIQWSKSPILSGARSLLTIELIGCPETWVRNYHYTLHNIPEERRSHLHHSGSPKWRKIYLIKSWVNINWFSVREIPISRNIPDGRLIVNYPAHNVYISWSCRSHSYGLQIVTSQTRMVLPTVSPEVRTLS